MLFLKFLATFAPAIAAGMLNMAFLKTGALASLDVPLSSRLFGPHKTVRGVAGYVVLGALCFLAWGAVLKALGIEGLDCFYAGRPCAPGYSLFCGALCGAAYAAGELPNSFLKRRLGVGAGESSGFFLVLDQFDSVIAVGLVLAVLSPEGAGCFLPFVLLGGAAHACANVVLKTLGLRSTWL